ncbi:disks large homolog 5-like [Tamandua tetradactyla]|uniref:disks large homolog 5-like n=1 Tax=Tamandua tetradactyla TaxID=48850 RepID=UPI0040544B37
MTGPGSCCDFSGPFESDSQLLEKENVGESGGVREEQVKATKMGSVKGTRKIKAGLPSFCNKISISIKPANARDAGAFSPSEPASSLAYQRVQKVDSTALRPVLVLGPLLDVVKEMLVNEAPGKFCRCPLEVMKASQQDIERGVKDCLFVDYKRRSGHFDVTTVASIKEITEKNRHCLLDIAPHAIERLHNVHIYPIVIFIHYESAQQTSRGSAWTLLGWGLVA